MIVLLITVRRRTHACALFPRDEAVGFLHGVDTVPSAVAQFLLRELEAICDDTAEFLQTDHAVEADCTESALLLTEPTIQIELQRLRQQIVVVHFQIVSVEIDGPFHELILTAAVGSFVPLLHSLGRSRLNTAGWAELWFLWLCYSYFLHFCGVAPLKRLILRVFP